MTHCAFAHCKNTSKKYPNMKFYSIPRVVRHQGEQDEQISTRRRQAWITATGRQHEERTEDAWSRLKVCERHFLGNKPANCRLEDHVDWAPSINLGKPAEDASNPKKARIEGPTQEQHHEEKSLIKTEDEDITTSKRLTGEDQLQKNSALSLPDSHLGEPRSASDQPHYLATPTIGEETSSKFEEVYIKLEQDNVDLSAVEQDDVDPSAVCPNKIDSTQCGRDPFVLESEDVCQTEDQDLSHELELYKQENEALRMELKFFQSQTVNELNPLDLNSLTRNASLVKFYTGFPNFALLKISFDMSCEFIPTLSFGEDLSKLSEFLLVLMKLRLNLTFRDLALRFNVDEADALDVFVKWIEGMYVAFKPLIKWPEKEARIDSMPLNFRRHFGDSITAIVDCFEICIQRPYLLKAQAQTWSVKKGQNTIKFLISTTPQGTVNFISKSWGGLATERQIVVESGFLTYLRPGDVVMVDKEFPLTEDLLAPLNCSLAISSQDKSDTVGNCKRSYEIEMLKSQVDQIIAVLQDRYQILVGKVPVEFLITGEDEPVPLIDKIVTICCALVNISPSLFSNNSKK